MQNFPPPSTLSTDELVRYAQMQLDRKESLPVAWQEELVTRLTDTKDDLK
jgi:hypothetical protein